MAITIKKQVQKAQAAQTAEAVSDFSDQIDQIGKLAEEADALEISIPKASREKIAKIAALRKEAKAKAKELASVVTVQMDEDGIDPDKPMKESGTAYVAEFGKRGTLRTITDLPMIKKLMDDQDEELFMKLAKMNIGDIDSYLTPAEQEMVLETTLQDRSLKIVPKVI